MVRADFDLKFETEQIISSIASGKLNSGFVESVSCVIIVSQIILDDMKIFKLQLYRRNYTQIIYNHIDYKRLVHLLYRSNKVLIKKRVFILKNSDNLIINFIIRKFIPHHFFQLFMKN